MSTTEAQPPVRPGTEVPASVLRHMEAEHRGDLEATLAEFADDCYYLVPGLGLHLRGRREIRDWYEELFAAIPDFGSSDERYWTCVDGAAQFVLYSARMEGTHLGVWDGWHPTGKRFSTPVLVRIPIAADGRMLAEEVYFDSADLFTQLGLLPQRGSRAESLTQLAHRGLMFITRRRRRP